jgi:hypothetical protein
LGDTRRIFASHFKRAFAAAQRSDHLPNRTIRSLALTLVLTTVAAVGIAEPIAVRQTQGATRGFLVMHSEDGKVIAYGELSQVAHGERLTTRLIYRFRDGSIDDDITTYTQHETFKLVSDHHIQKGPYFPNPSDYTVDVASGNVTSRTIDKDGKEKVEVNHFDLPSDVYNGMVGTILLNAAHNAPEFKVGMLAPAGKGRLVKLAISPDSEGTFHQVGVALKATIFRIKVDLGGVAGVIAPVIGKQPKDTMVWVLEGEVPGFVRQVGQLYEGGPVVSIELSGTSFPRSAPKQP